MPIGRIIGAFVNKTKCAEHFYGMWKTDGEYMYLYGASNP